MKRAIELLLCLYQRWISPALPPACRYTPTCSEYAREAVARHGALRGVGMALWRLLRCNPLAKGGYDPVVGGDDSRSGGSTSSSSLLFPGILEQFHRNCTRPIPSEPNAGLAGNPGSSGSCQGTTSVVPQAHEKRLGFSPCNPWSGAKARTFLGPIGTTKVVP